SRQHRVMAALDPRHIHEPGRAAHERAAGKRELRHRLPAALCQCARAVREPRAALERFLHERMSLKALEFLVRREIGIFVIEMQHEADRHESVVEMIKERATPRAVIERPAKRVLYQPSMMFFRRDLPQLLQTEPKFLRFATLAQGEPLLEYLGE